MNFRNTLLISTFIVASGWASAYYLSSRVEPLPILGNVQDFSLVSSENKEFTAKDLLGKVWIANAFFTSCEGPCPAIMATVAQLAEEFANETDVRLVSLSVDPERDNPAALHNYAVKLSINPQQWLLLTGQKGAVNTLLRSSFNIGAFDDPQIHTTRLILVDRENQVRGTYLSVKPDDLEKLKLDVESLL